MIIEEKIKNKILKRRSFFRHYRFSPRLLFERTAFYGLSIVILLAAISYGTVDPWIKSSIVFLICLFASFRIFEGILAGSFSISDGRLLSPLLGILILAVIQLIPYFNLINEVISPNPPGKIISYDPYETKVFILTFCALLLTGEILLRYTNTQRRLLFLIYLVLIIGIGSALFGFTRQFFFGKDNIILTALKFKDETGSYAQFANKNHFVFLMEMTLGLLAGLLLKADLPQWLKPLFWIMIGLVCFVIISANSRGGILSMIGLGLFTLLIHFFTRKVSSRRSRSKRKSISKPAVNHLRTALAAIALSSLFVGIAIFTVAFVGGDPVVDRLESIQGEFEETDNRNIKRGEIWKSTLKIIEANPIAGTGFGAYAVSITPYDKFTGRFALEQAHNDYLELLAAGGIIAFLLMLIFIVILSKRVREQMTETTGLRQASCLGAATGIFGVLLHSTVEFGLHIIINSLIFTILVVIIAARIPAEREIL